jgi:hypothetical protein
MKFTGGNISGVALCYEPNHVSSAVTCVLGQRASALMRSAIHSFEIIDANRYTQNIKVS